MCGVTESVSVSSEGLNGSNCQLALWRSGLNHQHWPTADVLEVLSSGAPEGVTECTGILLGSLKLLEDHNAVSDVLELKHETNAETPVAFAIGLYLKSSPLHG